MSLKGITGRGLIADVYLESYVTNRYTVTATMIGRYVITNESSLPCLITSVPSPPGEMVLVDIDAIFDDGQARYVWTYEAAIQAIPLLEIEGATQQEPITSHPRINEFISKYSNGFEGGRIIWKQEDPDGSSGRTGLPGNGNTVINNVSPLYGVDSYQSSTANYSYETIYPTKKDIPENIVSELGYISTDPPDVSGETGALVSMKDASSGADSQQFMGRNWLYVGVRVFQTGAAFVVRRSYLLSGFGGWMPEIYSKPDKIQ